MRAAPVWCYDAAVEMKKVNHQKAGKAYVLKWRARARMSNKLWKLKNKKMVAKWKKLLKNMPTHQYEKLFPDVYNWVKKFTITTPKKEILKKEKSWGSKKKKKRFAGVKMWQVCRRMKFTGATQDFSMWACLFGDPAFTKVTVEELVALVPYMKIEIQKFRQEHKWWPHPAVLLHTARKKRKQHLQEVQKQKREEAREVAQGTKRKASGMNGKKVSGYKHIFWHGQSQCWRALVKNQKMRDGRRTRWYEHFAELQDAVKAVSDNLGIPAHELKKPEVGGDKKMASLYDGVFYDTRKAYQKKWMACIYVKKCSCKVKVCKSLGHFRTMILAAMAVAKAQKKKIRDIRKSKRAIYRTRSGKDLAEQRFRILSSVFVDNFVGKKHVPANPPDYEKSEMLMKCPAHKKMFRDEPVMEEASIGLKYGPPRDDLLQAWKKSRRSAKYWGTLATKLGFLKNEKVFRKLRIIMTLQNVAKMLHQKDCSFWVKNAGRFVSKHVGPAMFLRRNGVVQKKMKKTGKNGKVGKKKKWRC